MREYVRLGYCYGGKPGARHYAVTYVSCGGLWGYAYPTRAAAICKACRIADGNRARTVPIVGNY